MVILAGLSAILNSSGFLRIPLESTGMTGFRQESVGHDKDLMMLATAALENWYISVLDIKTAFLYEQLDEEIYME